MTTGQSKVELLRQAAEHAANYVAAEADGPVIPGPAATIDAVTARLSAFDLDNPADPAMVLDTLSELGAGTAVRSTGGRYFGFVTGGTDPTALAASVLASAWDQNAALPVMSPLAAAIDEVCVAWLNDLLGLPSSATSSFCAGASVANLTAILTARDALLSSVGWDAKVRGLRGSPELTAIVSAEIHVSAVKALRLAGIGEDSTVIAPVDSWGRIEVAELPPITGPTLIVTQVGNVNTGHADPVADIVASLPAGASISDWAGRDDQPGPVWIHVDGAFGLWAAASSTRRHQVEGVGAADSWATDCHKWLNVPYDCGLVSVAEGRHLLATMSTDAAYLDRPGDGRQLMHLGLQMSQAARAIPVWATLAAQGRRGVADLVDRCCDLAERMADGLAAGGATILAPVVLNQVLVSFGGDEQTDAVVDRVVDDGRVWMGATTWQGRRAMRISVSDTATTATDADTAVAVILEAWSGLTKRW